MNTSLVTGLVIGAVVATAGGAIAGYTIMRGPQYAEVTHVEPIMKTVRTPREKCEDVPVTQQAPTRDPHRITGTAIGAVVGGIIGHQIGGGSGRDIATVAGAAAGGYAGNRVQANQQQKNTVTTTEHHCQTVYDAHKEQTGYQVTYRLKDQTHTVRMDHDPGNKLPVKDGEVVLAQTESESSK